MDQVSRPMQIALVAVVLLAGMWFAVLRPKSGGGTGPSAPVAAAPAPGTAGLSRAVDKAHGASATSDAANAATQAASAQASGEASAPSANAATATPAAAAKPAATKAATAKAAAKPAATKAATTAKIDRSTRLLASLAKGKTVVLLFSGKGADDRAARRAVQRAAHADHRILAAFAPIGKVGDYDAITSGVEVLTAPTILVIGKDRKAVELTGYVDQRNVRQAVGDVRRAAVKN